MDSISTEFQRSLMLHWHCQCRL